MKIKLLMVREGRANTVALTTPQEVFRFMRPKCRHLDREHVWRIDLDARNNVLGHEVVSIGSLTASIIHPREIFKGAILNNAAGFMIAHNHPSQDVNPSAEDKEITQRLRRAGELLGIPLIDHLVLADDRFFSFRDRGLL